MILTGSWPSGTGSAANDPPEIRVGSELDFRPYAYTDKEGRPIGFGVELLKAVADKMGLRIRIVPGPWDQVWNGLVAGQLDVLPVVARTPGREPLVDFSLPHTETFDAFFVKEGRTALPDLAAAAGKEIVVLRSDAAHHQLDERKFAGKVILVESIPDGLRLIAAGKHDAMLCSKLVGVLERDEAGIEGVKSGPPIPDYKRVFSFAVGKGDSELLEKLNQGLLIVKTDGTYDRIYGKWLSAEDRWRKYEKYLLPAGVGATAVVLAVGIWLSTLRRMVKARTKEVHQLNLELERRVTERTDKLRESEERLRSLAENVPCVLMRFDRRLRVVYLSPQSKRYTGIPAERFIGRTNREAGMPAALCDRWDAAIQRVFDSGAQEEMEFDLPVPAGARTFALKFAPELGNDGEVRYVLGVSSDITERKRVEEEQETAVAFLRLANESRGFRDLIRSVVTYCQRRSGCEAVGFRLQEEDDFPYFEARGFPEDFVQAENRLCAYDTAGKVVRDGAGNPVLDCMCGKVICGRIDPSKTFFTACGSFWTNCTTEWLASTTEADRQARTRNRCNGEGYESVALIPLRIGQETLGLLQMNDRQKGKFSPESIALWERLAVHLSVAILKCRAEEALHASLSEKEILLRELSHRTKNNMQVIAGLISLQAATFSDGKMLSALSDTQYRIRAMALVHEKLHRSGNFASLNVREYIEDLLRSILNAHHGTAGRVRTDTDLDDDFISIDSALPLGLIINELVSNSLKYAFPHNKSGTIMLSLKVAGERTELKYRDDGPGLPPDFDLSRIGSLGLKLVNNLAVLQLGGTMEIRHGSDTEFVFTFGDLTHRKGEYHRV